MKLISTLEGIASLQRDHKRYELLRTLNPRQFADLFAKSLREGDFDGLVDAMVLERELSRSRSAYA